MTLFKSTLGYLSAAIISTAISVFLIPIATRVLGPQEYGILAVGVSIGTVAVAAATAFIGYILPEHFSNLSAAGRKRLVTAAGLTTLCVGLASAMVMILAAIPLARYLIPNTAAPLLKLGLCITAAGLAAPWAVATEICMLSRKPAYFIVGTIAQSIVNSGMVILLLFVWPIPDYALIGGYVAGQITLLIISGIVLLPYWSIPEDHAWLRAMSKTVVSVGSANVSEALRAALERSYLSAWASVSAVGLFAHVQLYKNMAMLGINAISRTTWSTNVEEAKQEPPRFVTTYAVWGMMQALLAASCVAFALIAPEFIDVLSNGKFAGAAPYAQILLAAVLVQTLGKPQMTLLIARGDGGLYSHLQTIGTVVSVAILLALTPFLGIYGALAGIVSQLILTRLLIIWFSRRHARIPTREHWVVVGVAGLFGALLLTEIWPVGFAIRVALAVGLFIATLYLQRREIVNFVRQ